jgi:hypothetical protein
MITFELHESTPLAQARGMVALLASVYGPGVLPKEATVTVGDVSVSGPASLILPTGTGTTTVNVSEPDAASVFGTPRVDDVTPVTNPYDRTGVERDSAGIPWDDRIHASTKTKTANGAWTRRRNTDDALFDNVMAELKAANTAHTLQAAQVGGLVPPPPSSAPTTAATVPSPPPADPVVSSTAPGVPAPPVAGETTFPQLMMKVTRMQAEGKLAQDAYTNLLLSVGAKSIVDLSKNKALIPAFDALIDDHLASQG